VQQRERFGPYTTEALRNPTGSFADMRPAEFPFIAQLADALDAAGFVNLNEAPAGWGWLYQVEPLGMRPPVSEVTADRHVTEDEWEQFAEYSIDDLGSWPLMHPDASEEQIERVYEMAVALKCGSLLYLHEAPKGWGWTVAFRERGGKTVLRELWPFPEELHHPDYAHLTPWDIFNRGIGGHPHRARFYAGLAAAMRLAGYGTLADVPRHWEYTPRYRAADRVIDRNADPMDMVPSPALLDPDFLAACTTVTRALPDVRIPGLEQKRFRRFSTWELRESERFTPNPDPEAYVWTMELADALDAAGFNYLHEVPPGWGWSIRGHDTIPTSLAA